MGQSEATGQTPTFVGLCPSEHVGEFYVPLEDGDSAVCPVCSCAMVIYEREPDGLRVERLRQTQKVMGHWS